LFTAHLLETADAGVALGRTVSSVFDLLQRTHESNRRELQLVQSQAEIAEPRMQFEVQQIR
jgi:pyridoxine kinase